MIKIPPYYVNGPSGLVYARSADLSKVIIVSALRLWGLGWAHGYKRTDPYTREELCKLLELERSQLYGHLAALVDTGVLRYTNAGGKFTFHFSKDATVKLLEAALSDFSDSPIIIDSYPDIPNVIESQDQQQQYFRIGGESEGGAVLSDFSDSVPVDLPARFAALDRIGIGEPTRTELAHLTNATPEYLQAWARDAERHPERKPGYYVLQIRGNVPPPAGYEAWGTGGAPVVTLEEMPEPPEGGEDEPILPPPELTLKWDACLGELALQMTQATFDTWLRDTKVVSVNGQTFTVVAKSHYAVDWLNHRLMDTIQRTMTRLVGSDISVEFITREQWTARCVLQEA